MSENNVGKEVRKGRAIENRNYRAMKNGHLVYALKGYEEKGWYKSKNYYLLKAEADRRDKEGWDDGVGGLQ